ERAEEVARVAALLERARAGQGALVTVEGPAGIGKSSLLRACRRRAQALGMRVLEARGDGVSMESPFAAVRELLGPAVREARAPGLFEGSARLAAPVFEGDVDPGEDHERAVAVLYGLHWLVADLAERGPLALLVDDGHWLDPASVRFLAYLARRISTLPVLLVVAVRRGEPTGAGPALAELAAPAVRLAALSETASAELVRRRLGPRADGELCRSCHDATGGNPFYLGELVTGLSEQGERPSVEAARRVRRLGAGAVGRSVLIRLGRLGGDCERLAQAVAILGPGAPLRQAAALSELAREAAEAAADRLRATDLFGPGALLSFAHPIVHEAIRAEMPRSRRAALHARAAELLLAEGAPAERVAAHLLSAEPYGEAWVVEALRTGARQAMGRGAPETAVSLLHRALAEPPRAQTRVEVLLELGRAEAMLPINHAFASLREALALAGDEAERVRVAEVLAAALVDSVQTRAARAVLEDVLRDSDHLDAGVVERLEAHLLGAGASDLTATRRILARTERHFARARRDEVSDPLMLVALAGTGVLTGLPAAQAAELARQALRHPRLLDHLIAYNSATRTLAWTDQLDEAAEAQDVGIAEAQRRGSAPLFMHASTVRSITALRMGQLGVAEDHAERAHEVAREMGAEHFAAMFLLPVLIERGRLEEGRALAESLRLDEADLRLWQGAVVLAERGRVRIGLGELDDGVADVLEADRRMTAASCDLSVFTSWVPTAVRALAGLGRTSEARQLAERERAMAEAFGACGRLAIAVSLCGELTPGKAGLASLREAVDRLNASPARLEWVRSLVALGIGLRDRGQLPAARKTLAKALDAAHACGAAALAQTARAALVTTGARPRRASLHGPEALTPAELRAAQMAARGLSNREVAQALFVSTKTVEAQLSAAYGKLGIRSRAQLGAALRLGADPPATDSPVPLRPAAASGGI
ncbi:MAG TPA: LuxR family transcriptional regulator, partial [Solirubrobacteraceae bacterium]|nr:LuxR family transcriptional regulator [Solirubrobacteraceae bacterium]